MQEMVLVKDAAEVFSREARAMKDAIEEVLSEPADMLKMYLTDRAAGKAREMGEDDDVELLLES